MMEPNNFNKEIQPIVFDVMTALCVLSQIQLASRHPGNRGDSKKIAIEAAKGLQMAIAKVAPELNDVMEMGWNPDFDC
jgi:hypothetical protein